MSEKTLSDVEGALKSLRKRLRPKKLGYLTAAVAVCMLVIIVGSTQIPTPKPYQVFVIFMMVTIGVLTFTLLFAVWMIAKVKAAVDFFELAFTEWADEHNELELLRRVVGIGSEPIQRCPHQERLNLQRLVKKMQETYTRMKREHWGDEASFRLRWKNFVEGVMKEFGQQFAFAAQRIGAGRVGVTNYAVTVACRECVGVNFDPSRYLIDLYGLRKKEEEKELSSG